MVGRDRALQGAAVPSSGGMDAAKSTQDLLQRRPGHCPKGHKLSKWVAQQGTCDGCGRAVEHGERVMDCRSCNWYLCRSCLLQPPDEGLWGTFSYLTDVAAQQVSDIAAELSALVPSCSAPVTACLAAEELRVGPEVEAVTRTTTQPEQLSAGGHLPAPAEATPGPEEAVVAEKPAAMDMPDLLDLGEELRVGPEVEAVTRVITQPEQLPAGGHLPAPAEATPGPEETVVAAKPAAADTPDLLDLGEDLLGLNNPAPSATERPARLPAPPPGRPVMPAPPVGAPVAPAGPLDAMLLDLDATTTTAAVLPPAPASGVN